MPRPSNTEVLVDNSKSLKSVRSSVEKTSVPVSQNFCIGSISGDTIRMVVFNPTQMAYEQRIPFEYEIVINPPAWKSRQSQQTLISQKLAGSINQIDLVDHSPILEAMNFRAQLADKSRCWHLVIISDLLQSTDKLSLTPDYLNNHSDEEIIQAMLGVCPKTNHPPVSVTIYWYPGLVTKDKPVELDLHERLRDIYRRFIIKWADPKCQIKFMPLKEETENGTST